LTIGEDEARLSPAKVQSTNNLLTIPPLLIIGIQYLDLLRLSAYVTIHPRIYFPVISVFDLAWILKTWYGNKEKMNISPLLVGLLPHLKPMTQNIPRYLPSLSKPNQPKINGKPTEPLSVPPSPFSLNATGYLGLSIANAA